MRLGINPAIVFFLLLSSCSITVNMTGARIHESLKTIQIETFVDVSGNGAPDAGQKVTEALKDFFQTNSRLKIVNPGDPEPVDLILTGEISKYEVISVGYSGNSTSESASLNRLNMGVKASLECLIEIEEDGYDVGYDNKSFANTNAEFSADEDFTSKEAELVDEAIEQIVQEMFTKSFSSW